MSSELILLIILKNYGVEMAASVPIRRPPRIAIKAPFKNAIKDKNSKMLQEKSLFYYHQMSLIFSFFLTHFCQAKEKKRLYKITHKLLD